MFPLPCFEFVQESLFILTSQDFSSTFAASDFLGAIIEPILNVDPILAD